MSKRSNECSDGSDNSQQGDEPSAKRKRVTFESVRLLSVSGVNDLNEKVSRVQAYKLSEQLVYKNKLLKEREKEMERLRQRQETDEETSCTINRHWSNLDEQLRAILRGASTSEADLAEIENEELQSEGEGSTFLSQVVQMNVEQSEKAYDKRVKTSVHLLDRVRQQGVRKSEIVRSFIKKVATFIEANPANLEKAGCDMLKELAETNKKLADEALFLSKEATRCQQELSGMRLRLRKKEDDCEILSSKNAELATELEDLKFDLDKSHRHNNKLEMRLVVMEKETKAVEIAKSRVNGQTNGSPTCAAVDSKEVEALKLERDDQAELASRRSQEISEMNERIQKLVAENTRLKYENSLSTHEGSSKDFANLKSYYSLAIKEYERLSHELEEATVERDLLRQSMMKRVEDMKTEEEMSVRKVMSSSEQVNADNLQIRSEYDMLRLEFEQALIHQNNSIAEAKQPEMKLILGTLKTQYNLGKQESAKYKKKWRDTVNMLAKLQREHELLRKRVENSLIIELECVDGDSTSHVVFRDDLMENDEHELNTEVDSTTISDASAVGNGTTQSEKVLRIKVEELTEKLRLYSEADTTEFSFKERAELLNRERKLKQENEQLIKQIKVFGTADQAEKKRIFEIEVQTHFNQVTAEMERYKRENERLEIEEKALSDELENIGQALEELQEQNGALIAQKRDKEDQVMKMMNDRIVNTQLFIKLKEENTVLDQLQNGHKREIQVLTIELQSMNECLKNATETLVVKTSENAKQSRALEQQRKTLQVLGFARDDLQIRNEKLETQLKELQQVLSHKASYNENLIAKCRRKDEEMSTMRKKLERHQKSEKLGSTDAVLNEEIRQLKDVLTCPSCKVNRKDGILTKCFHVFCMQCIKTRYDTRQRKCPKCNAGFGANDFHRVYLT